MSDPAIEAARRVEVMRLAGKLGPQTREEAAAREMANPIRDVHKPEDNWSFERQSLDRNCAECDVEWPCYTAKLIYTTEELEER